MPASQSADSLVLEVSNLVIPVMTGIYSKELNKPQPLRFDIRVWLEAAEHYGDNTPLDASKNYMDIKHAAQRACPTDRHIVLIEGVADAIISGLMAEDDRIEQVEVKIVKLAISERGEEIGLTLTRSRRT